MVALNTTQDDGDLVPAGDACSMCGERHQDRLVWIDDNRVRCANCNAEFEPGQPKGGASHDA